MCSKVGDADRGRARWGSYGVSMGQLWGAMGRYGALWGADHVGAQVDAEDGDGAHRGPRRDSGLYGAVMGYLWGIYGAVMGYLWGSYGALTMSVPRSMQTMVMVPIGIPVGIQDPMGQPWGSCGVSMGQLWGS